MRKRTVAPPVGGMVCSTALTLRMIPAMYPPWTGFLLRREFRATPTEPSETPA